jgi:hypothetical protein
MKARERSRTARVRPRRWRRAVSAALTSAGLAIGSAAAAPPAQAWTWDSNVTVWGYASCKTGVPAFEPPAIATWVYDYGSGEIAQQPVTPQEFWAAHLHNVPSSGTDAAVWIYCAVPGEVAGWRYVEDIEISRPWVTTFVGPYNLSA